MPKRAAATRLFRTRSAALCLAAASCMTASAGPFTPDRASLERRQLVLTPPALDEPARPGRHAFAFRLTGFELGLHPDAAFAAGPAVVLEAARATLDGEGIRMEEKPPGRKNIGFWDSSAESVHWLARLSQAGRYRFRLEYAAVAPTRITLRTADGAATVATLPATGGWDRPAQADLGFLNIPASGIHHLILAPADPASWKAVNVWSLRAAAAP